MNYAALSFYHSLIGNFITTTNLAIYGHFVSAMWTMIISIESNGVVFTLPHLLIDIFCMHHIWMPFYAQPCSTWYKSTLFSRAACKRSDITRLCLEFASLIVLVLSLDKVLENRNVNPLPHIDIFFAICMEDLTTLTSRQV